MALGYMERRHAVLSHAVPFMNCMALYCMAPGGYRQLPLTHLRAGRSITAAIGLHMHVHMGLSIQRQKR